MLVSIAWGRGGGGGEGGRGVLDIMRGRSRMTSPAHPQVLMIAPDALASMSWATLLFKQSAMRPLQKKRDAKQKRNTLLAHHYTAE